MKHKSSEIDDEMVTPEFLGYLRERVKEGNTDLDEYECQVLTKHYKEIMEEPKKKNEKKVKSLTSKIQKMKESQKSPGKLAMTLTTFSTGIFGTATPALMASGLSAGEISVMAVGTSLGLGLFGFFSQAISNKLALRKLKKQLQDENNITLTKEHKCGETNEKGRLRECDIQRGYGMGI